MTPFLDSSALVKRYVPEEGTAAVRDLVRKRTPAVCRITYAEIAAATVRAWRAERVTGEARDRILARLDRDFGAMSVVEVRRSLVERVPALVVRHALRAYDAIQLAAALMLHERGAPLDLWAADGPLVDAARAEGLRATLLA